MPMPDPPVFDEIRDRLGALSRAAPSRAAAVSLEAALRSLTSAPLSLPDDLGADSQMYAAATRQALAHLLTIVCESQWHFTGHDRRRLTICAMWLRTAERYWDDAVRRSTPQPDHFLFPTVS